MKKRLKEDPELLKKLIFTDETKLRIFENSTGSNFYVTGRKDERLKPENVDGAIKYGRACLTFWGCINYHIFTASTRIGQEKYIFKIFQVVLYHFQSDL